MKAFTAVEELSGEYSGMVVYANTNIEARRIAADNLNDGELGGLRVTRERRLDKYEGKPIPLFEMIWLGWWDECHNCGIRINEDLYCPGESHEGEEPCGVFHGAGFCSSECEIEWLTQKEQEPLVKYRMLERLKGVAEQYVVNPVFSDDKSHCWICWDKDGPKVSSASVVLDMPDAPNHQQLAVNYKTLMDGKEEITLFLPYTDAGKDAYRKYATKALDTLLDSR